jgi:hypothetical protein
MWPWPSGKEYHLIADSSVPAASGTVKVNRDKDNGNTKLDIKVDHLAKPSSLTPPANAYIVWVRPNGGDPVKQGAIGVGKDLKGELQVVTVSKDFDLLITAEQSDNVTAPSGLEVLHTHLSVG